MRHLPPEPSPGNKITAELVRELIRCIRERTIVKCPDYSTESGPNGTILKINFPEAKASKVRDFGCWNIISGDRTENEGEENETNRPVRVFGNQFYIDGEHNLNELHLEDAVEDFVCQGELQSGQEYTQADYPFVCLRIPATTLPNGTPMLVGYKSVDEVQALQKNLSYVVKPLYKFTHDGRIAVDFRNCPALQVAETW